MLDTIEGASKGHGALGPQPVHELNLLCLAPPAHLPVLSEGGIFHRIPAHPNAEAQTPTRDNIELRRLLGYQRRLALRQEEAATGGPGVLLKGGGVGKGQEGLGKRMAKAYGPLKV